MHLTWLRKIYFSKICLDKRRCCWLLLTATYYGGTQTTSTFFSLPRRSERQDEPVPVLSVPGRWDVRVLLFPGRLPLPGPLPQAGSPDVVEVVGAPPCNGYVRGLSPLLGVSDHDHLRGEVRVRFSALPSDVADQNPHDGCHRLHHHSHDSGHLSDLSAKGIQIFDIARQTSTFLFFLCFSFSYCLLGRIPVLSFFCSPLLFRLA